GKLEAVDDDVDQTVTYAIDLSQSTCAAAAWATPISVDPVTGALAGTASTAAVGTCVVSVTATSGSLVISKPLTITVTKLIGKAQSAITLSSSTVAENVSLGTTVGTLTATDADVGDTFTFALTPGSGDTDNSSYTISVSALKVNTGLDF